MTSEIPIESIRPNPFNSRSTYTAPSIKKLAVSISEKGQLSAVKVRPHPTRKGLYQLVFGHRRYYAARKLGLKKIAAEIVSISDEEMSDQSLIENYERENISDYELANVFQRMHQEFHLTYEQIGKKIGVSPQLVSNHIAMLRLFTQEELATDQELVRSLGEITEHHARILSRVEDRSARRNVAKMIVAKDLSVRELGHIVSHLRSWFQNDCENQLDGSGTNNEVQSNNENSPKGKISRIIEDYLRFAHEGNSEAFMKLHFFGEGFSMYDGVPPYKRLDRELAFLKKHEWVTSIAPELKFQLCDQKVDILGSSAVAELIVAYEGHLAGQFIRYKVRGTLVLVEKEGEWKIAHEHWSRMLGDEQEVGILSAIVDLQKQI